MHRSWLYSTMIRVLATMAEAALGVIGASKIISDVDWAIVLGTVAISGITTFLRCLAGLPEVEGE